MLTSRECVSLSERDQRELGARVADSFTTENVPFFRDVSESIISKRARAAQDSARGFVVWVKGYGRVSPDFVLAMYERSLAQRHVAPHVDKLYERLQASVRPGSPWPPKEA